MMNIKYIGRHPFYKDTIYGTGLEWVRGVTVHPLEDLLAKRFLRHGDSFELVAGDDAPLQIAPKHDEYTNDQAHHDLINQMSDIGSVASYVFTNFAGYRLPKDATLESAKQTAKTLYNQFLSDEGDFTPKANKPLAGSAIKVNPSDFQHPEGAFTSQPIIYGGSGDVCKSSVGIEWGVAAPNTTVISLAAEGKTNAEIGKTLGLHHKTVAKILSDHGKKSAVGD